MPLEIGYGGDDLCKISYQDETMYRLDDHAKHRIIFLKDEGYTVSEIAESMGITVRNTFSLRLQ